MDVSKSETNDKNSIVLSGLDCDEDKFSILRDIVEKRGITVEKDLRGEYGGSKVSKKLKDLEENNLIERYKENLPGRGRKNINVAESTPVGDLVVRYIKELREEIESAPHSIKEVDKREIRKILTDIKELEKKAEDEDNRIVMRDYLSDLKNYINSESNPRAYLSALENEELIDYIYERVKNITGIQEVNPQNFHFLDLYLTIWEKTAANSDYNAKKNVKNNEDNMWDAITLSKHLSKHSLSEIPERDDEPPELKNRRDKVRKKAIEVIQDFFDGYFTQEPLREGWIEDVLEWYVEEYRDELNKEERWERILLNLSHDGDKRYVKKKLMSLADDEGVPQDAVDNIIDTQEYYLLEDEEKTE